MTFLPRATIVATALTAALTLGGCGSDEPAPTAQEKWAASLCSDLVSTTEGLQPPSTEGVPAEQVQGAIVDFLEQLNGRLDQQQTILADAGAPPDADPKAYDEAKESLGAASDTLSRITKRFENADASDAKSREQAMLDLTESLTDPATYQGPIKSLMDNDKGLAKTITGTPECEPILAE